MLINERNCVGQHLGSAISVSVFVQLGLVITQLIQQALAEIAAADARRIELADRFDGFVQVFPGEVRPGCTVWLGLGRLGAFAGGASASVGGREPGRGPTRSRNTAENYRFALEPATAGSRDDTSEVSRSPQSSRGLRTQLRISSRTSARFLRRLFQLSSRQPERRGFFEYAVPTWPHRFPGEAAGNDSEHFFVLAIR